tara:strand:+ start:97 stop:522 length:426 start_codon:yes stop_codon:yes gene_type:complete
MSRVVLLIFCLVAPLTGCVNEDAQCSEETIISEGDYFYCYLGSYDGDVKISWDYEQVSGSSNIDIYFMTSVNYQNYYQGNDFLYIIDISRENTKSASLKETSINLENNEYYIVWDHTTAGNAQPVAGDSVRIDVDFFIKAA